MENKILLTITPETSEFIDMIAGFVGRQFESDNVEVCSEAVVKFFDTKVLRVIVNPHLDTEFYVDAFLSEVTGEITLMDESKSSSVV